MMVVPLATLSARIVTRHIVIAIALVGVAAHRGLEAVVGRTPLSRRLFATVCLSFEVAWHELSLHR